MNLADLIDAEIESRKACAFDDLHSDPAKLAEACDDWLAEGAQGILRDLIAALTEQHRCDTSLDRIVLQHETAHKRIDAVVQRIVNAMESQGEFQP